MIQKDEDGRKVNYWKPFRMLIGVGSLREWPYHDKKVIRKDALGHQYPHYPGTFNDRSKCVTDKKRWSNTAGRSAQADELSTPMAQSE